jgi:hypothetical protein
MIGYKLTIEEKEKIQGVFFTNDVFFNCVQDIEGNWFLFLSDQDIDQLPDEYKYLLDLPLGLYMPPPQPEQKF